MGHRDPDQPLREPAVRHREGSVLAHPVHTNKVGRTIQHIAEETGVAIMTPGGFYAAGKLISQCAPISTIYDPGQFVKVLPPSSRRWRAHPRDGQVRHLFPPSSTRNGKYCGMVSHRNIINLRKRRIILVDHNEATLAVEGFDQAEILGDHRSPPHRQSGEPAGPVYFRNQPVGCTATIITQMYDENGVTIRRRSQAFCWRPSFGYAGVPQPHPAPRWTRTPQSVWQNCRCGH